VSAVLRLVRDTGGGDGEIPPVEAWEIWMRGAGFSEKTVREGVRTVTRFLQMAGKTPATATPLDVSRFLGRPELKSARSRKTYHTAIRSFYRWWQANGNGADITEELEEMKHAQQFSLPQPWEDAVNRWCDWLLTGGRSRLSIRTRRQQIRGVARGLGTQSPAEVMLADLVALFAGHDWKPNTRHGMRMAVTGFYAFCVESGICATNVAARLPRVTPGSPAPRPAPDWLWDELVRDAAPRELLMIRLAGEAGLRRAEIAQVHTDDVIWDGIGHSLIVHGKGRKQRVVPVTSSLAEEVQRGPGRWSTERAGWLFPGGSRCTDGHLSPNTVGELISALMPPAWSIHKLRHRYATRGYAGTRNLRAVQEALGHASVATTERYTAITGAEIRAVSEAAAHVQVKDHKRVEAIDRLDTLGEDEP
jgi:integrase